MTLNVLLTQLCSHWGMTWLWAGMCLVLTSAYPNCCTSVLPFCLKDSGDKTNQVLKVMPKRMRQMLYKFKMCQNDLVMLAKLANHVCSQCEILHRETSMHCMHFKGYFINNENMNLIKESLFPLCVWEIQTRLLTLWSVLDSLPGSLPSMSMSSDWWYTL